MHEPAALVLGSRFRNISVKAPKQVAVGLHTNHQTSSDQTTTKAVLPSDTAQGTRRKDAELAWTCRAVRGAGGAVRRAGGAVRGARRTVRGARRTVRRARGAVACAQ